MPSKNFGRLLCPIIMAWITVMLDNPCQGKFLEGSMIAVQFTVHDNPLHNETLEDVQEKMKLVSTKFERVFAFGIMAREDDSHYKVDVTYNQSLPQVFSAEAAGIVNSETPNSLLLFIGIYPHNETNRLTKEIELALETALISENRALNTVQGFVVDFSEAPVSIDVINSTAQIILSRQNFKDKYFGVRLNCDEISMQQVSSLAQIINKVKQLNLLVCVVESNASLKGKQAFDEVATKFDHIQSIVNQSKLRINVYGQTGFPARLEIKNEINEFQQFWETADKWATKNDFPVVMHEAFDNPWKVTETLESKYGLWDVSINKTYRNYVFKNKIYTNKSTNGSSPEKPVMKVVSTNSNAGVGFQGNETPVKYMIAIIGMILIRFAL